MRLSLICWTGLQHNVSRRSSRPNRAKIVTRASPLLHIPINALGQSQAPSWNCDAYFPTTSRGKGKIGGARTAIKPNRRFLPAVLGSIILDSLILKDAGERHL